jgi:tRNA pseudouridine55 synthase
VVSEALLTEVRDPRIGMVTVTHVVVSNELSWATVSVSVMGEEGRQGAGAGRAPQRGGLLSVEAGEGAAHPRRPGSEVRAGSGSGARCPDQRGAGRAQAGGPGLRSGALLVDKPVGPTSHDVVTRVRRALRMKAVGHTGTLDPFASGLL